jgi:hypothetical protein
MKNNSVRGGHVMSTDELMAGEKVTFLKTIASQVARVVRTGAAAGAATPGWCCSMLLPRELFSGEILERLTIATLPARATEKNELVRVDFNLPHNLVPLAEFQLMLCDEIGPFIEGVGKVRAHGVPEGLVVVFADEWGR